MDQLDATTHHHDPIVQICQIVGEGPKWVRVGRGTYPFTSYAAVSAAYLATIAHLDLGVSQSPCCVLLDEAEGIVARVAYNGRVFGTGADGESDYSNVLHEPQR